MNISLVQFNPKFGNLEFNTNYILEKIKADNSNLIVFPELAISGYDFISKDELLKYAVAFDSEYFKPFQLLSSDMNKIIVLGFPEIDGSKTYNSAALIFPDKTKSTVYRKTHLFFRERFYFDETDKGFFVVNYPDFDLNLGAMICYDWRFPEAARTIALKGADIIVSPSNLVTPIWHVATPARALENKVYLAIANRIGTENRNGDELFFNGRSTIYNYNGSELAKAGIESEEIITAETYPAQTRNKSFNEFNDIFRDRRTQFYQ